MEKDADEIKEESLSSNSKDNNTYRENNTYSENNSYRKNNSLS